MTAHPVTLFTGQWADLPFEEVARLASSWGYDGLEIAASGDHLDLRRAVGRAGVRQIDLERAAEALMEIHRVQERFELDAVVWCRTHDGFQRPPRIANERILVADVHVHAG